MRRWLPRLTFANVVATLALFLALGGASYAAFRLPAGSVGTKQLRNGAVTGPKISARERHALRGARGPRGETGPVGPQGATGSQGPIGSQGPAGAQGAAGSARAYAEVSAGGAGLTPSFINQQGFVAVGNPSIGVYCLTPSAAIDPATSVAVVSPIYNPGFAGVPELVYRSEDVSGACPSGQFAVITAAGSTATQTDAIGFGIAVP